MARLFFWSLQFPHHTPNLSHMEKLLRLDSLVLGTPEETPEGFLKVPASVTRAGIFEYKLPNGSIRRELRRPDQVYRADSMASLELKPFVNEHPYADDGEVNAGNSTRLMRGMTSKPAYKLDGHLCIDVIITDAKQIKDVKAGKVALSAGYKCDTLETPGIYEGQRYDAEQVNIFYNHVASVKRGRAGQGAKLRLDADFHEDPTQEPDMIKIKLDDGREIEVSEEAAAAFKQMKTRQDSLTQELATEKGAKEALQTKLDAGSSADEEAKREALINERVKVRSSLLTAARTVLPVKEHVKLDSLKTDTEIMVAVIKADAGDVELKLDDKDENYIQGRFDTVMELRAKDIKKPASGTQLGSRINQGRADADEDKDGMTPEELRAKKKKALTDRYKTPISGK